MKFVFYSIDVTNVYRCRIYRNVKVFNKHLGFIINVQYRVIYVYLSKLITQKLRVLGKK